MRNSPKQRSAAAEVLRNRNRERNGKFINLAGIKVGRWTFIEIDRSKPSGNGVWWRCRCECGTERSRMAKSRRNLSCGCLQRESASATSKRRVGDKHPAWKGGRVVSGGGYIRVICKNHPRANRAGYVAEHILVVEQRIGRFLLMSESIHHINGIRDDNRVENLELWDKGHPPGQRHSEKMRFYMSELLKKCDRRTLTEFCQQILA